MDSNQTFNWGILGLGKIAHRFAQDLRLLPHTSLAAVGSRSADRARTFAGEYGAAHAAGSYAELFDGPPLDAVYIATPHVSHCELALMCLERGVPVLCEKPLGLNAAEVKEMIATSRRQKTFLMEALWTRFLPTTHKVLELIRSGAIGALTGIKADFGFRAGPDSARRLTDPALGGGALLDIGIYPVFLSCLLMGEPSEVTAMARLSESGVDLDTGILLRNREGLLSHLHCTLLQKTKTEAFIYGENGTIHWQSRWHEPSQFTLLREGNRPELFSFDFPSHGYHYEAQAVAEILRKEPCAVESPLWRHEDSLMLHRTLDRIREAVGLRYPGE